ncbi:MAG TPA: GNAT family N-acetyltransferase [Pseudonocardiaceae bacterium]
MTAFDGLVCRAYEPGDAEPLAALMNSIEAHSGGRPNATGTQLHGLIAALVGDLARDSTMVFDAGGTLVAAGFTTTPPAGGFRVYLTGGVHPRWRGRGIGRTLLERHLGRARELHRALAPEARWEAQVPRTAAGDERALRLFRRAGLTPVRHWFEMSAPARRARTAIDPAVRPFTPELTAVLHAAHHEAFAGNWGFQQRDLASWTALTVGAPDFVPELSFVVPDGEELAAYVLTYQDAAPGQVYIGHLGVRAAWRRRGLAGVLLASVLDAAAGTGRDTVSLTVDAASPTGAVAVYERAGFTTHHRAVTHAVELTT